MEALCIALALLGLMYFAYRGWSIILIAPFFAGLAALASIFDILPVYSELYMTRLAEYVKTYYPVFLFGAVFARLMEKGGLASSVAGKIVEVLGEKRAILAVLMGCGEPSGGRETGAHGDFAGPAVSHRGRHAHEAPPGADRVCRTGRCVHFRGQF